MFFNLSIETGKSEMIRAVVEGVCMHMRWMLETQDKKTKTSDTIRFVGGGALNASTCQILADCTGKKVETVPSPQNVGSVGAAVVVAVGLGLIEDISDAGKLISADCVYNPNKADKAAYDRNFAAYKEIYGANKKIFKMLNSDK
jgi:xylulokinase